MELRRIRSELPATSMKWTIVISRGYQCRFMRHVLSIHNLLNLVLPEPADTCLLHSHCRVVHPLLLLVAYCDVGHQLALPRGNNNRGHIERNASRGTTSTTTCSLLEGEQQLMMTAPTSQGCDFFAISATNALSRAKLADHDHGRHSHIESQASLLN